MKRVADEGEVIIEKYEPGDGIAESENVVDNEEGKRSKKSSKEDVLRKSRGSQKSLKALEESNDLADSKQSDSNAPKSALRDPHKLKKGLSVSFRGGSTEDVTSGKVTKKRAKEESNNKESPNKTKGSKKKPKTIANKAGQKFVSIFKKKKKGEGEDKPAEAVTSMEINTGSKKDDLKRSKDKSSKKESKSAKKTPKEKKSKTKKK
jgi:hypothetical protein